MDAVDDARRSTSTPPLSSDESHQNNLYPPPPSPSTSHSIDQPLLAPTSDTLRAPPSSGFVSSPLNPNSGVSPPASPFARSRPVSRAGSMFFSRIASEDSQVLTAGNNRASMLLYKLASDDDNAALIPPRTLAANNRDSVISSSGDSLYSMSADSKYPSGVCQAPRGLVAYAYDPALDEKDDLDADDEKPSRSCWSWRGLANIGLLVILVLALLCLFIFYPVLTYYRDRNVNVAITDNTRVNGTGQVPVLFQMPQLIDPDTPNAAKTRKGFDGYDYDLVFSDEFETEGRTFFPGDDPFWEAADIWYGSTMDQEWYDPGQVTTTGGHLQILMEQVETHGLPYRSGMLQSWNKFCFTHGYVEVSLTLPGPDSSTQGYWPGAWTMGNLGRPGYMATTDGTWPYSYDSCDVGTFPNQTYKDGSGPAAAVHSDQSRSKYNYELSWLPGQRLSSCTCAGEDHPGPSVSKGRGAPEIDILEAEQDKATGVGQVVSQSAQFAPFTHDYLYFNDTADEWAINDTTLTRPNTYRGSAVQQAVSALTHLPDDMFQGSGQVFTTLGFEYWTDPGNPSEGFITWQTAGAQTVRMGAAAMGADTGEGGSMVSQRIVPEEPMSIVLNLGISSNWQTINLASMEFPAQMLVDYVRVYQRKGETNVGCSPEGYPTEEYINNHMEAYTNPNLTRWINTGDASGAGYSWPKNSLYDGC